MDDLGGSQSWDFSFDPIDESSQPMMPLTLDPFEGDTRFTFDRERTEHHDINVFDANLEFSDIPGYSGQSQELASFDPGELDTGLLQQEETIPIPDTRQQSQEIFSQTLPPLQDLPRLNTETRAMAPLRPEVAGSLYLQTLTNMTIFGDEVEFEGTPLPNNEVELTEDSIEYPYERQDATQVSNDALMALGYQFNAIATANNLLKPLIASFSLATFTFDTIYALFMTDDFKQARKVDINCDATYAYFSCGIDGVPLNRQDSVMVKMVFSPLSLFVSPMISTTAIPFTRNGNKLEGKLRLESIFTDCIRQIPLSRQGEGRISTVRSLLRHDTYVKETQADPPHRFKMTSAYAGALRRASTLVFSRLAELASFSVTEPTISNALSDTEDMYWEFVYQMYTSPNEFPSNMFDQALQSKGNLRLSMRIHQMFALSLVAPEFTKIIRSICAWKGTPIAAPTLQAKRAIATVMSDISIFRPTEGYIFDDVIFREDDHLPKLLHALLCRPNDACVDYAGEDQPPFFRYNGSDPGVVYAERVNMRIVQTSHLKLTMGVSVQFSGRSDLLERNQTAIQRLAFTYLMMAAYAEDYYTNKCYMYRINRRLQEIRRVKRLNGSEPIETAQLMWPESMRTDYKNNTHIRGSQQFISISDLEHYNPRLTTTAEVNASTRNPYSSSSFIVDDIGRQHKIYGSPVFRSKLLPVDMRPHMRMHGLNVDASPSLESSLITQRVKKHISFGTARKRGEISPTRKHAELVEYTKKHVAKIKRHTRDIRRKNAGHHDWLELYPKWKPRTSTVSVAMYGRPEQGYIPNKQGQSEKKKSFGEGVIYFEFDEANENAYAMFDILPDKWAKMRRHLALQPTSKPSEGRHCEIPLVAKSCTRMIGTSEFTIDLQPLYMGATDILSMYLDDVANQEENGEKRRINLRSDPKDQAWLLSFARTFKRSSVSTAPLVQMFAWRIEDDGFDESSKKFYTEVASLAGACIGIVPTHALGSASIMAADALCLVLATQSIMGTTHNNYDETTPVMILITAFQELLNQRNRYLTENRFHESQINAFFQMRNMNSLKTKIGNRLTRDADESILNVAPYTYGSVPFTESAVNMIPDIFTSVSKRCNNSTRTAMYARDASLLIFADIHACKHTLLTSAARIIPNMAGAGIYAPQHFSDAEDVLRAFNHPFADVDANFGVDPGDNE